jgi:LacI family transcriptional regulator
VATIRDVALVAGVSLSTVSNVMRGRSSVREPIRQRVLQAAEQVGYLPDGLARALRTGRSRSLALCVPFITNPTVAGIIRGAARRAHAANYTLTICDLENDPQIEQTHLELIAQQRAAAVITLAASDEPSTYQWFLDRGIPVVFVDRRPPGVAADFVTPDHRAGTEAAVRHLLESGRERIALLTGPRSIGSSLVRIEGYRAAYAAAGEVAPEEGFISTGHRTSTEADAATRALISAPYRADAVVCGNASLTLGALSALRDVGVRIPDDVALVGAGDVEWARLVDPPLTMIQVDAEALGENAVDLAIRRLAPKSAQDPPREIYLTAPLIVRASSEIRRD